MTSDTNKVDLSNRVGQLFLMDDDFFKSPFMREKIPKMLFRNENEVLSMPLSTAPFGHAFSMDDVSRNAVITNIPVKIKGLISEPKFTEMSSVRNSTPIGFPHIQEHNTQPHLISASGPVTLNKESTNVQDRNSDWSRSPQFPNYGSADKASLEDNIQKYANHAPNTPRTMDNGYINSSRLMDAEPNSLNNNWRLEMRSPHRNIGDYNISLGNLRINTASPDWSATKRPKFVDVSMNPSVVKHKLPPQNVMYGKLMGQMSPAHENFSSANRMTTTDSSGDRKSRNESPGRYRSTTTDARKANNFTIFPSSSLQSLPSLHRETKTESSSNKNNILRRQSGSSQEISTPLSSKAQSNPDLYPKTLSQPVGSPDSVEEAIRSLEEFDPIELINISLCKNYQISRPGQRKEVQVQRHFNNGTNENLPQLADMIRHKCQRMRQLSSQPGWRSYGELECKLTEIRSLLSWIKSMVERILADLDSNARQRDTPLLVASEELREVMNELNFIYRKADSWSLRRLWRGAWAETTGDDLDRFNTLTLEIPSLVKNLLQLIEKGDTNNGQNYISSTISRPLSSISLRNYDRTASDANYHTLPRRIPSTDLNKLSTTKHIPSFYSSLPKLSNDVEPQDVMDGGESTTSSTNTYSPTISQRSLAESKDTLTPQHGYIAPSTPESQIVMEEDDLMSLNSTMNVNERKIPGSLHHTTKLAGTIDEDDQEILEYCALQINQNNEKLNLLAQAFYNVIEKGEGPEKFGQKAKMITMIGNVQTQLARNIVSSIRSVNYKTEFEKTGKLLENTVKYCEESTQTALKQYPQVSTIQSLISAVNSICQQSQNLNILMTMSMYKAI